MASGICISDPVSSCIAYEWGTGVGEVESTCIASKLCSLRSRGRSKGQIVSLISLSLSPGLAQTVSLGQSVLHALEAVLKCVRGGLPA